MKRKTTTQSHTGGTISVTVTEPDRLRAILALAKANKALAKALSAPIQVHMNNCVVSNAGIGIKITNEC